MKTSRRKLYSGTALLWFELRSWRKVVIVDYSFCREVVQYTMVFILTPKEIFSTEAIEEKANISEQLKIFADTNSLMAFTLYFCPCGYLLVNEMAGLRVRTSLQGTLLYIRWKEISSITKGLFFYAAEERNTVHKFPMIIYLELKTLVLNVLFTEYYVH